METKKSLITLLGIVALIAGVFSIIANESYGCYEPPDPDPPEPPVALLEAVPEYVILGKSVTLDGSDSYPDIVKYEWDFTNDGDYDYTETPSDYPIGAFDGITTHIYSGTGDYTVKLRVTRINELTDTETCMVYVSEDLDEDDLPDGWETYYFGNYTTYGAEDDPDSDGCKNLREYLHGTNPDDDGKVPSSAITIYVPYNARFIQRAINVCITDDTIEVEPGRYVENLDFTDTEITLTSTEPDNRAVVDTTIIDGCGDVNSVIVFDSGDADSTIAGFTITNGYADDYQGAHSDNGGGIYCYDVSPTISNCVITVNFASDKGGGIYCKGTDPEEFTTPTISDCTISENTVAGTNDEGGGIYCGDYSNLTISDCIIENNKAPSGGGMSCISAATITHSVFSFNKTNLSGRPAGGGICFYDGSDLEISDCLFVNNRAGYWGGGIYHGPGSSLQLTNCIFWYNSAGTYGGGGVCNAGGSSFATLTNCTFYGNEGTGSTSKGGGLINCTTPSPTVVNSIFWGNTAGSGSTEEQQIYGSDPDVTYCCIEDNSEGQTPIPFGGGSPNWNIDDNPLFVSADDPNGPDDLFGTRDDGLFLATNSPCIDKGNDSDLPATDIIGNERIADGDHIGDPDVDMGPYELPKIWFVDKNVGSSGDGKSWGGAFKELRDALDPEVLEAGDEIWVAEGTYKPHDSDPAPDPSVSFELVEDVGVYGGFLGAETETGLTARDWTANATTLSGDITGDNSYHVVEAADGAILDGFIITGGNADGSGNDEYGGGIYCYSVSFTLGNCAIVDNEAAGDGGGMYCEESSPTVSNCVFADNTADHYGGGVFNLRYSESGESYPVFSNCVFSKNTASEVDGAGGGILFMSFYPISAELVNCTFYGNEAYVGGGMVNIFCNMPVTNCVFWGNTATVSSQISTYYGSDSWKPTFSHCDIYDCGGSGEYWDFDLGGDGGGNIAADPCFVIDGPDWPEQYGPDGEDGVWATIDDGLMPDYNSPCINAARFWHFDTLFWLDVIGRVRKDVSSYPDIGAYESKYKIILAMCFIDETLVQSYYDDEEKYTTDMTGETGFEVLLAGLPYDTKYSIVKTGCIVPGNIADVLPADFFEGAPPEIVEPGDDPVGISIAECDLEPDGDELIDHFHRIREGIVPDCIIRLGDYTSPLWAFGGLGDGYDDFVDWLEDWLEDNGLDPTDTDGVLPEEETFDDEQWIKAIRDKVNGIVNP